MRDKIIRSFELLKRKKIIILGALALSFVPVLNFLTTLLFGIYSLVIMAEGVDIILEKKNFCTGKEYLKKYFWKFFVVGFVLTLPQHLIFAFIPHYQVIRFIVSIIVVTITIYSVPFVFIYNKGLESIQVSIIYLYNNLEKSMPLLVFNCGVLIIVNTSRLSTITGNDYFISVSECINGIFALLCGMCVLFVSVMFEREISNKA
ncbi:MAG: hypothetical protein KJ915_07315 [Candidatus Omnitrophica bacterium]|nr:hypothetical protein [Candidatus Omnitrophota bacterium]